MPEHTPQKRFPRLTAVEKICFIILKAREFDAKVEVVEPDPGSNPADDGGRAILEDYADDATHQELLTALELLNDDERIEVLALAWLGRGDYGVDEWDKALALAAEVHNAGEPAYLVGTPLLGDYLENGLDMLGHDCADLARTHL